MIEILHLDLHGGVIASFVRHLRTQYPDTKLGAGGTWSSPKIITTEAYPGLVSLIDPIWKMAARREGRPYTRADVVGWANIMKSGDSIARHNHFDATQPGGRNDFSAIYYPEGSSAKITFWEEQYVEPVSSMGFHVPPYPVQTPREITPDAGMLLFFPAWLEHSVEVYRGDGERVSLAFNVKAS